ncbi:MAG: flagellar hook-basal body complex protein FliE [Xanthobacteraceae bacterium]|nr:flagellar hook-basal body complex protein FliE [Xanthobacteraceae bacterium]MBX3524373.1 flagellar hook-basal body complex protein FliE [Xanthobacteraceae bacterium]MBX3535513.1 flagellar hook-basal body complex protein FliE [Xanthobacteraceae bacterium]MBX3548236.1 flagellar hook-basal body complex protein FliE [Xanthobacteraceae bacterium]MCW5675787.1 flagellar hook-basal body complex protein FliE [Xanthobacteraceae bacterium]
MSTPSIAANAYAALQRAANGPAKTNTQDNGFGDMLKNVLGELTNKGTQMDAKAAAAANGKGDLVDVVTAVAETEVAVETMVSVRDKVIAAYEEIMRMPI